MPICHVYRVMFREMYVLHFLDKNRYTFENLSRTCWSVCPHPELRDAHRSVCWQAQWQVILFPSVWLNSQIWKSSILNAFGLTKTSLLNCKPFIWVLISPAELSQSKGKSPYQADRYSGGVGRISILMETFSSPWNRSAPRTHVTRCLQGLFCTPHRHRKLLIIWGCLSEGWPYGMVLGVIIQMGKG